jgi:medium-chain acyl-[acyl-carrier-protein] hydrolase
VLQREDAFTVKAFDCRPDGRMKVNALMQYLQEGAACHAEQLGFGLDDMSRRNCFWVLANLRLEISHEPKWMDRLTIRTWPSGHTRLAATREFIGTAGSGRELFRAGSEWMVLDRQSGRPQNLTRFGLNLPQTGPKALSAPLHRLKPADGYVRTYSLQVPFSALDFNGHVNNTEYVRWALDGLSLQLGQSPQIRAAHVTYLAEVFQGDDLEVLVASGGDGRVSILERKRQGTDAADVCLMELACQTPPDA